MIDSQLQSYDFELPDEAIAQEPPKNRGESRLMVLDRNGGNTVSTFSDLLDFLPDNALLVANNSQVLPARVFGQKPTGGRVEFLLLTPLPLIEATEKDGWQTAEVKGLLRASKAPKPADVVTFSDDFRLHVIKRGRFGQSRVRIEWRGDLRRILESEGHIPLPPYIRRPDSAADRERYQTVYADSSKTGSVAAPTAGLHFTPELRERMAARGIEWAEVTLFVGYGTFSPVRAEDIREHEMHSEYIEISEATAEAIRRAKAEGRPVVAVGTTSVRTLEGAFNKIGKIAAFAGETDIFISPGYQFCVVDHMITNFHLPLSSLIIMVSAFAGRERILATYRQALENGFKFFSYGDAMLIL